jgi:hypothetical protein
LKVLSLFDSLGSATETLADGERTWSVQLGGEVLRLEAAPLFLSTGGIWRQSSSWSRVSGFKQGITYHRSTDSVSTTWRCSSARGCSVVSVNREDLRQKVWSRVSDSSRNHLPPLRRTPLVQLMGVLRLEAAPLFLSSGDLRQKAPLGLGSLDSSKESPTTA